MRWKPSPFIWLNLALHLAAIATLLITPGAWIMVLLALFLLHCLLAMAGLIPRCKLLGQNLTRLPAAAIRRGEIAITLDDGPDPEVTPQVLEILAQHAAHATFFCIAEQAARYPELCRQAVAAGHMIENHGLRHLKRSSLYGPAGWQHEVLDAQTVLEQITGRRPQFYRPIAGLRNLFLDPLLQRHGLFLACWTRRSYDTHESNPDIVLSRLIRNFDAGDILLLHDGHSARSAAGRPVILDVLPRLLNEIARRKLKPVTLRQACERP